MAGFLDKLLGKKKEQDAPSDGGSWADHEVSVDITDTREVEILQEPLESEQRISAEKGAETADSQIANTQNEVTVEQLAPEPAEKTSLNDTVEMPVSQADSPEVLSDNQEPTAESSKKVDMLNIDTADLRMATNQAEVKQDPIDVITKQIQDEIVAEKSRIEKKERLEKLIEVTNQLKRPEWDDEDFDV